VTPVLPPVTNTVLPSGLTATETAPSVLLPGAVVPLQPQPGTGGDGVADGGAVRARGGPGAFSGGKHLDLPSRCGYQRGTTSSRADKALLRDQPVCIRGLLIVVLPRAVNFIAPGSHRGE
jgi:hypothetical protein